MYCTVFYYSKRNNDISIYSSQLCNMAYILILGLIYCIEMKCYRAVKGEILSAVTELFPNINIKHEKRWSI